MEKPPYVNTYIVFEIYSGKKYINGAHDQLELRCDTYSALTETHP